MTIRRKSCSGKSHRTRLLARGSLLMRYWIYLILWLGYSAIYTFLVFASLADGHGTFLFADTLFAWILFVVAVVFIPLAASNCYRAVSLGFLLGYSFVSLAFIIVEQTGNGNFERTIKFATERTSVFVISFCWFLVGQSLAWFLLFRMTWSNRTGR